MLDLFYHVKHITHVSGLAFSPLWKRDLPFPSPRIPLSLPSVFF